MDIKLDVEIICGREGGKPALLSIGYGSGHVVVEIDAKNAPRDMLTFLADHKEDRGSSWTEIGRFASCPVTLSLNSDFIALIIDSDLRIDGFGQSAGIYIPRQYLNEFMAALERESRK